jgi:hypothetical protein
MRFVLFDDAPGFAGNEPVEDRVVTIVLCPHSSEQVAGAKARGDTRRVRGDFTRAKIGEIGMGKADHEKALVAGVAESIE